MMPAVAAQGPAALAVPEGAAASAGTAGTARAGANVSLLWHRPSLLNTPAAL